MPPPAPPAAPDTGGRRFACPTCGAGMRFAPGTTQLVCPHCGNAEPIPDRRGTVRALDLASVAGLASPADETEIARIAHCATCGADVVLGEGLHARECPFCASPLVVGTGPQRRLKPQAQLPFLLTEAEARAAMTRWLGRLWFAPLGLRAYARTGRAMQGVYVPYWLYAADTQSRYSGERGRVHHQNRPVRTRVGGRNTVGMQRTALVSWTRVRGTVARRFDVVLVLASQSLPKRFTDAVAPWDLSALSAFEPRYLAGFNSESYAIPVEQAYAEARRIMDGVIAADVRADIGGDQQRIARIDTEVDAVTVKHVLLPIWLAAYRFRGRSFRFVVNGHTGAVDGERPYSKVKIALAILAAMILALALAAFELARNG